MIKFLINSSINTGKTGDVERSPRTTPMLSLEGKIGTLICEISSPRWSTFCLGIWANLVINKYTCGRFEEWDNTVLQLNSKSVGREAELRLSRPPEFYRSEALQQAEARSTKIVFVRRNFSAELSLATYWSPFYWMNNESLNITTEVYTKEW